jgi:RHS repeat-associated protein
MERDDEVKGEGNSYDFGARMYDSRLGRFLSIDAFFNKAVYRSPYTFAGNSPIVYIDVNGDSVYRKSPTAGKSTKVMIVILSADDIRNGMDKQWISALRNLDKIGWEYVVTDNMTEALEFVANNYKPGSITDLGIRTHSAFGGETSDGSTGLGIQSGIDKNSQNNNIGHNEIMTNSSTDPEVAREISAWNRLSFYLTDDANVLLTACDFALKYSDKGNIIDKEKLSVIGKNLLGSETINIYVNANYSTTIAAVKDPTKGVTSREYNIQYRIDGQLTAPTERNPYMWLKISSNKAVSAGKDVNLNKSGIIESEPQKLPLRTIIKN